MQINMYTFEYAHFKNGGAKYTQAPSQIAPICTELQSNSCHKTSYCISLIYFCRNTFQNMINKTILRFQLQYWNIYFYFYF
jgi:hypothetical protein